MVTGDAAYIKKMNRSLIIQTIVNERMISRADLSKATSLTRATISAQVADLLETGLLREIEHEHSSVGRKPIMLSLNAQAGYAIGIDLDYGEISFTVTDLLGKPVSSKTITLETTEYQEIVRLLARHIRAYIEEYKQSRYGIVGMAIAIHGLVSKRESIHFVPRFRWHHLNLKKDLENEIGCDIPIFLENNANLSALAERVFIHHETNNLLCLTLYSGIGLGMIINNEFFQGYDGFAGEAGHMIVVPDGRLCNCGNKGCWEKYASESCVFESLAKCKQVKYVTYEYIQKLLAEGDEETERIMEQFIYYLAVGINNIINLYNPEVVVLNSRLLGMHPDALGHIQQHLRSSISHYRQLSLSTIGKKACILGACALAITHFLDVPIVNLPYEP